MSTGEAWAQLDLKTLTQQERVTKTLLDSGLSLRETEKKAILFAQSSKTLIETGLPHSAPAIALFAPGRIEVLGKHTDYAGGQSLVTAVEKGFCLVAVCRQDTSIRVISAESGERIECELSPEMIPTLGHWSNYPMTVARRLARNFPTKLRGADISFASDLPSAAGLSSSSAMIVVVFLSLAIANELTRHPEYQYNIQSREDLAEYLGTVENGQSFRSLVGGRGVGAFGGSEDHTAILSSKAGMISQFSYSPVCLERVVPLPKEYTFAVCFSGVVAEKTGNVMARYNRASNMASAIVELWQRETGRCDPHLRAALASSPEATHQIRRLILRSAHHSYAPSQLLNRFEHFFTENEEIIPAVPDDLSGSALQQFGQLVDCSQELGARLLGNQVPETIQLAASARQLGAVAASAFGAGFGGSVWALVTTASADQFLARWGEHYRLLFPNRAEKATFFTTHAGPGTFQLTV